MFKGVYGHQPRKRFGQHWLKDLGVLSKIVRAADLNECDRVLEIGPGRGALTEQLLKSKASLIHAIELDNDLIDGLKQRFYKNERFTLKAGDVLRTSLVPPDGKNLNKVVANIPYNITSPLLYRLIGRLGSFPEIQFERMVLLLQKEVADRMLAKPGKSTFSAMSVRVQLLAKTSSVCEVPPHCFKPSPKVHSKVVILEPFNIHHRAEMKIEKRVETLLKTAFIARRKKLKNTLSNIISLDNLDKLTKDLCISLDSRPQELSPMNWLDLAIGIEKMNKKS